MRRVFRLPFLAGLLMSGCMSSQSSNSNCYPLDYMNSEWRIPKWKNFGVHVAVRDDYGWWYDADCFPNEDGCIELNYPKHIIVRFVGLTRAEFRNELVSAYRTHFKDPFVQWHFCGRN